MKMQIATLLFGALLAGCTGSGGGGSENGGGPAKPGNEDGSAAGDGSMRFACMVVEPKSRKHFVGVGKDGADASLIATEFCTVRSEAGANCATIAGCEERQPAESINCTVTNTATGDVWTSKGRSRLEAFALAHGICSVSQNANTTVCGTLADARCTPGN